MGRRIYKHRGCLIIPEGQGWQIVDYMESFSTLDRARNFIDLRLGGTATAKIPKRWAKEDKFRERGYDV